VVTTFQWFKDGVALAGDTASTLIINGATPEDSGTYECIATDSLGSIVSDQASLDVITSVNPGRLINISCRAFSGTGADQLIAGYVIGGLGTSGQESVLVRASGPALAGFGVSGVLPDPKLTLDQSISGVNVLVDSNAGWGGSAEIAEKAMQVGAFAWSQSSLDSALAESLSVGAYTAQVTGSSGDTGVALAEVYDATPEGTYTTATPRLINISARVEVGTGSNILIAGFEIGGDTSKTVLIRGSGPALAEFGLTDFLPDPQLTLFQSLNGTNIQLATNSGWGGDPQITATADSVGAFSWGTSATPDSAILVTLAPGAYTVEVQGASGDTGVALVEVYEVQ
jgi:hypothetical protein